MKKSIYLFIVALISGLSAFAENPAVLYMIGHVCNWQWSDAIEMQPVEGQEGQYSYTGKFNAGEFKIYAEKDSNWSGKIACYHPLSQDCQISETGVADNRVEFSISADDNKWKVTDAGQYTITLDINTMTLSATYIAPLQKVLYMIGDVCGWNWNNAIEMQPVDGQEDQYSYTGDFYLGKFKIYAEKNPYWSGDIAFYHPAYNECAITREGVADNAVLFTTTPDDQWKVTQPGKYTITLDTQALTISATFVEPLLETDALYMIGKMTGWNINGDDSFVFTKEENNIFVFSGELEAGTTFQAMPQDALGNWSAEFLVATTADCPVSFSGVEPSQFNYSADHQNNSWKVTETGTYTLKFDLTNWTLTATGISTAINSVVTENELPVEYYNLQGVRIDAPADGLYLKRQGDKVSKVLIK